MINQEKQYYLEPFHLFTFGSNELLKIVLKRFVGLVNKRKRFKLSRSLALISKTRYVKFTTRIR